MRSMRSCTILALAAAVALGLPAIAAAQSAQGLQQPGAGTAPPPSAAPAGTVPDRPAGVTMTEPERMIQDAHRTLQNALLRMREPGTARAGQEEVKQAMDDLVEAMNAIDRQDPARASATERIRESVRRAEDIMDMDTSDAASAEAVGAVEQLERALEDYGARSGASGG